MSITILEPKLNYSTIIQQNRGKTRHFSSLILQHGLSNVFILSDKKSAHYFGINDCFFAIEHRSHIQFSVLVKC